VWLIMTKSELIMYVRMFQVSSYVCLDVSLGKNLLSMTSVGLLGYPV
jgi:hypothetical protein